MADANDLVLSADIDGIKNGLTNLSGRILSAQVLPAMAKALAKGIDRQFLQHGLPEAWLPLAESTVKKRRRDRARGKQFVAGDEDQLRVTDTLRRAATDVTGGVVGSAYRADTSRDIVQVGVDNGVLPYASTQQFGNAARNIPARPYIVMTSQIEQDVQDAAQNEINLLAADFARGMI